MKPEIVEIDEVVLKKAKLTTDFLFEVQRELDPDFDYPKQVRDITQSAIYEVHMAIKLSKSHGK